MSEDIQEKKSFPFGLKTEKELPVPLKSIKVDINITGYVAEVTSNLTYFNEEKNPVEAVFTFPVDDGSAVFQFEAEIDGRHIVAEIQEKEQAILTYQDAVDHGKTAMLLKEDNSAGDIFSCMLGNLPPESEASLLMKYVIELPQEADGRLRFTLPTILNPRYSPDFGSLVAAENATYVPASKVPYDFSMTTTVKGYYKVTSVTSNKVSLDVQFENENKTAKVSIGDEFKFDHDLCLFVEYKEPFKPQIVLEDGNPEAEGLLKEDVLMVSFHPDLKEVAMATGGEYIFVIDRSGSMDGEKIQNAKEALLLFLKSLPPECYFNVISFGSSFSSLFSSGSKKYAEGSLNEAIKLQEKMSSDLGGTEILKPLKHIFSKKLIQGHPRRVFILTDGEVCNTNEVIRLVRKCSNDTDTRVFSLGIGYGASTALIKGMANNGGGKAEFVTEEDRVQPKVISLLKCAMQPAITNIAITWDLPPGVTPVSIPTESPVVLSAGDRLTLFAILQGVDKFTVYAQSSVTVTGKRDGTPVSYSMTFTLSDADDISESAPVHRLATKAQIKLLQDQETEAFDQDDRYSFPSVQPIREKVIDVSCHGNIVSKYTAFVAIDKEGKRVEGKCSVRPCPVPTLSEEFNRGIHEIKKSQPRSEISTKNLAEPCSLHLSLNLGTNFMGLCSTDFAFIYNTIEQTEQRAYKSFSLAESESSCYQSFNRNKSSLSEDKILTEGQMHAHTDNDGHHMITKADQDKAQDAPVHLRSCSLDLAEGSRALKPATMKKRSGGFLGCGPKLSKLFSKRSRARKRSKAGPAPVDAADGTAQELNPDSSDKAVQDEEDAVDSSDVKMLEAGSADNADVQVSEAGSASKKVSEVGSAGGQVSETVSAGEQVSEADSTGKQVSEAVSAGQQVSEAVSAGQQVSKAFSAGQQVSEAGSAGQQVSEAGSAGEQVSATTASVDSTNVTDKGKKQKDVTDGDMLSVVALQQLHGQWIMSDKLMKLVCLEKDDIEKLDFSKDQNVVCTVIVICWLWKQFSHRKDEWQMIETKALLWLSSQQLGSSTEDVIKHTAQILWQE